MKFLQGVKKRTKQKLVRICQYDFPDTNCFGGNVLDDKWKFIAEMYYYFYSLFDQKIFEI